MSPEFESLCRAFNVVPSAYCDSTWLPEHLSDDLLATRDDGGKLCHRILSPWMFEQYGLAQNFEFEFAERYSRLALIDRPHSMELAALAGLVSHHQSLRHVIDRPTLQNVRAAVPRCDIKWLLREAASVEAWPQPAVRPDFSSPHLVVQLAQDGLALLMSLLPVSATAVARRYALKFPKSWSERAADSLAKHSNSEQIRTWFIDRLIPCTHEKWTPLFS